MIQTRDLIARVIRPTLNLLGMASPSAERLLAGTAVHESTWAGDTSLDQEGGGPALGIYQIEPATRTDLIQNFLRYRPELMSKLVAFEAPGVPLEGQLIGNLHYATAVARLIYYRRPEPLPQAEDSEGLAGYWKAHFNTRLGKGRVEDWLRSYRAHVLPALEQLDA